MGQGAQRAKTRSGAAVRRPARAKEAHAPKDDVLDGDGVYRRIAAAIREQRLTPGAKLAEERLGRIFAVSRPVVRHALMRLAHDHIVELRPNKGAFVATPTQEQARQVFEARRMVEAMAVRACAEKATKKDISRLRKHLAIEAEAWVEGRREDWIRLTGEFHLLVADIAGNSEIRRFLGDLVSKTSLIIALFGGAARTSCPDDHHSDIVDAIAVKDAATAERLMIEHLVECEQGLQIQASAQTDDLEAIFREPGQRAMRGG